MQKRVILLIIDSFGVGAMDDVVNTRPNDIGSNTALHVILNNDKVYWPALESLGLMNVLNTSSELMKPVKNQMSGISKLKHFGADSFFGHQEIMGTKPKQPKYHPFSYYKYLVLEELKTNNINFELVETDVGEILVVENCFTVADNVETDPGQAFNITADLNVLNFKQVCKIAKLIRNVIQVPRLIVFGSQDTSLRRILNATKATNNEYYGIDAPKSGVYTDTYECLHMGYGINPDVQLNKKLEEHNLEITQIGKVADVVYTKNGNNIFGVDTKTLMQSIIGIMDIQASGIISCNIQETDLAGHSMDVKKYKDKVDVVDIYLQYIIDKMKENDILIVMADHGDDPTIGHAAHTREYVPILVKYKNNFNDIGVRETMADVGATICEYLTNDTLEFGTSFLNVLKKR